MNMLIIRRSVLLFAVILTSLVLVAGSSAPQVKTRLGAVEGKDDGKVRTFLGIPYAAPGRRSALAPAPPQGSIAKRQGSDPTVGRNLQT
jgi:hypothetical protein